MSAIYLSKYVCLFIILYTEMKNFYEILNVSMHVLKNQAT